MPGHPTLPRRGRLSYFLIAAVILGGGALIAMFLWLQRLLNDALFAGILTLMLPVIIAPWLSPPGDRHRR